MAEAGDGQRARISVVVLLAAAGLQERTAAKLSH